MNEGVRSRVHDVLRRAGLGSLPPGVVGACVAIAVAAVVFALWRWWPASGASGVVADVGAPSLAATASAKGGNAAEASAAGSSVASAPTDAPGQGARLYVHVVGAVRRPGLYELEVGARVADALTAAGGFVGSAAEAAVNLARPVSDGEQIAVPTQDEVEQGKAPGIPASGGIGASSGSAGTAGGGASPGVPARVNINTADAAMLDSLPGVGPSTAAKIIAEREQNGPYRTPDDLARVPGIGPKKLESLRDLVVVQ